MLLHDLGMHKITSTIDECKIGCKSQVKRLIIVIRSRKKSILLVKGTFLGSPLSGWGTLARITTCSCKSKLQLQLSTLILDLDFILLKLYLLDITSTKSQLELV